MIKKYNDFINEGLRDKMVGVPQEKIDNTINFILGGDNGLEIVENYYEVFYEKPNGDGDEDYTFIDYLDEVLQQLDLNTVKEHTMDILSRHSEFSKSDLSEIKELNENENDSYLYFEELSMNPFIVDVYEYYEYQEDLIVEYDIEEIKKIVMTDIKNKMDLK